ncbi:MAG TPA: hypothetical protein PKB02_01485 [Anaerohalosphaeraceae bacterium]|nr:hypothetical protein [Anaerohalosphaeraceae bacterium]
MESIKLITWISSYVVLATILFNMFRYGIRLNLPSSLILSASVSFLLIRIGISKSFGEFFSEYIHAFIVSGVIVAVIVVTAFKYKQVPNSACKINTHHKRRSFNISDRKG